MKKFFYRVNGGDSVMSLACKFGVPPLSIINDNSLTEEISEGDVVFIDKTERKTYVAEVFDTVESVAAKFNVSSKTLAEENGTEYLFYGLTVVIPE